MILALWLACAPKAHPDPASGDDTDVAGDDTDHDTDGVPSPVLVTFDDEDARSPEDVALIGLLDDDGDGHALLVDRATGDVLWSVDAGSTPQLDGRGVVDRRTDEATSELVRFAADGTATTLSAGVPATWAVSGDDVAWTTCGDDGVTLTVDGATAWTERATWGDVASDPSDAGCAGPVSARPKGGFAVVVPSRTSVVLVTADGVAERVYGPTSPPDAGAWREATWQEVDDARDVGGGYVVAVWVDGYAYAGVWQDDDFGLFEPMTTMLIGTGDAADAVGARVSRLRNGDLMLALPAVDLAEEAWFDGVLWQATTRSDTRIEAAAGADRLDAVFGG